MLQVYQVQQILEPLTSLCTSSKVTYRSCGMQCVIVFAKRIGKVVALHCHAWLIRFILVMERQMDKKWLGFGLLEWKEMIHKSRT